MSNERHPEIDSGKMGNVFRRMTLATLGLDDLEGVSEQSFDVVERADSFVERLFGNLSHVMPKVDAGRFESRATELSEHIYAGMAGMHGPKSATDLGDWQYWLDAALLMLFDEDEDEDEVAESAKSSSVQRPATANRMASVTPEAVRTRIAALKQSGVTPQMLHAMRQSEKRSLIENVKRAMSEQHHVSDFKSMVQDGVTGKSENSARIEEESRFVARIVADKLQSQMNTLSGNAQIGFLNSHAQVQMLSHLTDQMLDVSASIINTVSPVKGVESVALTRMSETAKKLVSGEYLDQTAVREVLANISELEKAGIISHAQAEEVRRSGNAYSRELYRGSFGHDDVISRAEQMGSRVSSMASETLSSLRALSLRHTEESGSHVLAHTFSLVQDKLNELNRVVSERVNQSGDSASSIRWQRVSERFERMHGISDEADRVLLRDVLESATELSEAGIIPSHLVREMAASFVKASTVSADNQQSSLTGKQQLFENAVSESRTRVLGQIVNRVEESIASLMENLGKAGISAEKTAGLMSDVHALTNAGKKLEVSGTTPSVVDTSSILASISERLDAFTQTVSTDVTSFGYDELTSEPSTFVSMQAEDIHDSESAVLAVRQLQQQMIQSQEKAHSEIRKMLSQHLDATQIPAGILAQLETASSVSHLENVRDQISSHLNHEQREILSKTIESVRKTEAHLENVSHQLQVIERAAQLSSSLKKAISEGKSVDLAGLPGMVSGRPVSVGDVQIQAQYLNSLKETLASYQRLQNHYHTTGTVRSGLTAGMNEQRLDQMLSLIRTNGSQSNQVQGIGVADVNLQSTEALSRFIRYAEQQGFTSDHKVDLGYDDIATSGMNWIKSVDAGHVFETRMSEDASETQVRSALNHNVSHYPSQSVAGDLSKVFGTRRAIEFHASELAQGQSVKAAEMLGQAIEQWAQAGRHEQSFTAYAMNDAGEQVKLSLNLSKTPKAQTGFELRQSSGQAYLPQTVRENLAASSPVSASLSMASGISGRQISSGVSEFVPVIAGVSSNQPVMGAADGFAPVLSQTSLPMNLSSADMAGGHIRLNIQNVSYELSPSDFVQMVAKPEIASAGLRAPALMNADHALFSGYASLMQAQGERRSLKALKRSYLDALSQSGTRSAHAEIGFSSQNFSDILGVTDTAGIAARSSVSGQIAGYAEDTDRVYLDASQQTSSFETEGLRSTQAMVDEFVSNKSQVVSSQAESVDYSWVSNQAKMRVSAGSNGVDASSSASSHHQQILSRIDNMLDYVEDMSSRDVGVFSTNETVRVLLEALPENGYLGDKGLPKWRQRNTKAARAAEARELREALAKIGASPIQGVQRLNDRHFVSPNLIQNNNSTQAAPLFSGGSDSSNASSPVSTLDKTSGRTYSSKEIPEEDLQYIAEEVYNKIVESLIEEVHSLGGWNNEH